ncbi:hypothetical protein UY3_08138 [Chelonia mydas]|uniref:Uncharacterized protein n=1 Tax=Chelonia mydas TaxID=8469 RepID=M7BC24_CHEMY|nr:hypothetical protein UY3_08138 [Chelonia mydas]
MLVVAALPSDLGSQSATAVLQLPSSESSTITSSSAEGEDRKTCHRRAADGRRPEDQLQAHRQQKKTGRPATDVLPMEEEQKTYHRRAPGGEHQPWTCRAATEEKKMAECCLAALLVPRTRWDHLAHPSLETTALEEGARKAVVGIMEQPPI